MSTPVKSTWREVAVLVVVAALCFGAFIALSSVLRVAVEVIKHAVHS